MEDNGVITKVVHVARNITERKKTEDALVESEAKYRALVENADDAILLTDLSGKSIYRNSAYLKNLGFREGQEAQAEKFAKIHPDDLTLVKDKGRELFKTGHSTSEYRIKHHNGSWVYRLARSTLICNASHQPYAILSIIRDITALKKTEEKLRESEEKYQTTFEVSMDALMLLYEKGFFDCNKATLGMFGCRSVGEFTKFHPADLSPPTQPDGTPSMNAAMSHIQRAFQMGTDHFFWVHKRTDGTTFPADVLLTRMPLKGREVLQATVRDITRQKKADEQLKENSDRFLLMNEKLRVVGSLTRHDVRNKLSTVTGYAYLLKKKHADQADIVEGLGKMELAVKDTMKIFDFAKMYEQIGAEKLTYIDVETKLNEAVALFSESVPKIINDCHGLSVLADSFLRQLFFNFIDNTKKYGQKTTTIRVHYEKTDQDNLKLVYEDDGVGIPLENKTQLFKEVFSTGGSTGFGLFLTKKMIDVYGWSIVEDGEPGKGAKFTITIPKLNKSGKENCQIDM